MMSATLIHRNTTLVNPFLPGSTGDGVSIVSPVMAVSVCRPPFVDGMPSRRGSAVGQSRQSSAKSLPGQTHLKLHHQESNPTAISLSSSVLQSYPPAGDIVRGSSEHKEVLTLPKIQSPTQLCSTTNSMTSLIDATSGRDRGNNVAVPPEKPSPPSIFPNFRALQRLAASAKLRINNMKSKEAKAITAMLNQEKNNELNSSENNPSNQVPPSCQDAVNVLNNALNSSWYSQEEDSVPPTDIVNSDQATDTSKMKTRKSYRSRSRRSRKGAKTPSRKKKSASPAQNKDKNPLGNYSLASTMTLNSRWDAKKVETFSTKYNKKFTARKVKMKDRDANSDMVTPLQVSLTTVALEKRHVASTPRQVGTETLAEVSGTQTPRTVLEQAASIYRTGTQVSVRLSKNPKLTDSEHAIKKVFLSEKQSSVLKDCGKAMPCAPPASPTPEQLQRFEYVPSLTDLRSQRALKDKLSIMDAEEKKKRLKQREDRARQEKQMMRSNVGLLRQRQRQEIYALNKVMTEHELSQFQKFCEVMKEKT